MDEELLQKVFGVIRKERKHPDLRIDDELQLLVLADVLPDLKSCC